MLLVAQRENNFETVTNALNLNVSWVVRISCFMIRSINFVHPTFRSFQNIHVIQEMSTGENFFPKNLNKNGKNGVSNVNLNKKSSKSAHLKLLKAQDIEFLRKP